MTGVHAGTTNGLDVRNLVVKSDSLETIETVAVGGAVGADVGVAGSVAINLITSTTDAHINGGAKVESQQNAGVIAESDDLIKVGAGAVGVGVTAAGVAASVVVNVIEGDTKAYIAGPGTTVAARDQTGTPALTVASGGLTTAPNLLNGITETLATFTRPDIAGSRATETVRGVVVNASATHHVMGFVANVGAGTVGISGVANVNIIGGNTLAYIDQATINGGNNTSAQTNQGIHVKASDHAYGSMFVGSASGGVVGVGLVADVSVFDRDTRAYIQNSTLTAKGDLDIGATSSQGLSTLVVAASGGAVGVVGAGSVVKFTSETEAYLSGSTATVGTADVKARHDTHMFLSGGAAAGGGVGVGATFDVGLDNSITKAHIDNSTVTTSGQVNVDAHSTTEIQDWTLAGAGAGSVAVAGTAAVSVIGNTTQAWVSGSTIGSAGARASGLAITAEDDVTVAMVAGSGAVGGVAGGGVAAGVTIVKNTTSAYMNNSSAFVVNDAVVDAQATRDLSTTVATLGGGVFAGLSGSVGVTLVGTALSNTQSGDTNANKELNSGGGGTLSSVNSFSSGDRLSTGGNMTSPSQNGYANAGMSSSEISSVNNRARLDTNAQVYNAAAQSAVAETFDPNTQLTGKTAAIIGGNSVVNAQRDVKVHASEKDKIRVVAGGGAIGGIAGVGGSVSVVEVTNNVEAAILGTTQTTADADANGTGKIDVIAETARLGATPALQAKAVQVAGGFVGLGAAVTVGNMTNNVKATIGRGTQTTVGSGAGNINIQASDTTDIDTEALGASVGAVAAGVVIDRAEKSGSVVARMGNTNAPSVSADTFADLGSGTLNVQATRSGAVKAKATAGAGGILAGSGADARAIDGGLVQALVGNSVDVDTTGGKVNITATAIPQTDASALGINIGAGAVGASLATARSNATVDAKLGEGSDITATQLDVIATRDVGAVPTARARATGASGGLLLGVNATVATAESTGTTNASVGNNTTLFVSGTTSVSADSQSHQASSGEGFSFGFIAVGADYSRANSNTLTQATLGDGLKITGGTVQVLAASEDANYAYGLAGSGGLASAPFSEASTSNTSQTYARTGSGNNTVGNARKIDVGTILVSASHNSRFNSWMDSTNASLIGVSGAKATNTVNATTEAHVGTNGWIEADNVTLQALNNAIKPELAGQIPGLSTNVPAWNVNSSSGGLVDVPAAGSTTTITQNALVHVGAGAHLEQTGDRNNPGVFNLDASNSVVARDKVKMSSGGAISAATGKSAILADTNNATVRVGDFAEMTSVGNLNLGARSFADIYTQTGVDVYGAVGVAPFGESTSRFQGTNTVTIGSSATMESLNDINLWAGRNTSGAANDLTATARTDVYNNTAIPVNRNPVADAIINTHSQITVGSSADIGAVRHVTLFAEEGSANPSGIGIGKDIYREALAAAASAISNAVGGGDVSFETRTGRSIKNQTSAVAIDGTVRVGIHRKQELEIGFDGTATKQTDGISIKGTTFKDVAADILQRIDDLNELIRQYTVDSPTADASIAVAAWRSEVRFLERKLDELGFPRVAGQSGFSGVARLSPRDAAVESVNAMTSTRTTKTTDKDNLVTANNTLTSQNTTLTTQNSNLTTQNNNLIANNAVQQAIINDSNSTQGQKNAAQNQINSNNATISANNTTITNNTNTINANNTTINANNVTITDLTNVISGLTTQINSLQNDLNNNLLSTTALGGPVAKFLTISDVLARLGNIYVRGDRLHGAGTLNAPGDAEIKITNNGPNFLILKNLEIPPDDGGKLYFNSIDVKNNTGINTLNGAAGGAAFNIQTAESQVAGGVALPPAKPQILVTSKYDPLDPLYIAQTPPNTPTLGPDLVLQGDISNLRGLVKIDSAAGSIRLEQKRDANDNIIPGETANIRAGEVEIKTRNGDFVQSYTNTFFHTAGAPLVTVPGDPLLAFSGNVDRINRNPEVAGRGIVANGSVLIAARYLNINGVIQSGIPEWGVIVPAAATVNVPGLGNVTFAQAQAHYNGLTPTQKAVLGAEFFDVSGSTVAGLAGNVQGNWEKVTVRYNAKENRLELGGVRVQGGFVELFGQIFNTNQNGGGDIRVMDGYGQIKIDNQSSLPMWINLLDTGRGVKGEVNITSITGLDANGAPVITTTNYTRNPGDARSGSFYNPQAGLRYTMTVGYDTVREDFYRYSQKGWFDIKATYTSLALDQYRLNSIQRSNDPLSQGQYLEVVPGVTAHYSPSSSATYAAGSITNPTGGIQTNTTSSVVTPGRSWKDCNWWTLCANATYYQEFTITTGSKTTVKDSVRADYPIGIEFIGFDQGAVNVNSTGSVVLNGSINNRNGNTAVTSTAGSITQSNDLAIAGGNNVSLNAATGIGATNQKVQVNVTGGKLDAISNAGEIHARQMVGDMKVGTIGGAGVANVVLETDHSILAWNNASYIQGQRVELLANSGGIGELSPTVNNPLIVKTGYTATQSLWPNYGLMATARDNINIKNVADAGNPTIYSGNLLLIAADSAAGDVRIETTGKVLDNNPFARTDQRTQQDLANLWDSLRLRGQGAIDKADEAVAAYENGKSNNYQLYWQLRNRQANPAVYDPGFQYTVSQAENDALTASGMNSTQITQFAANRTAQYHQLHAEVGSFTATYTPGFSYDASPTEEAQIRKGSSWTDAQLALSVGAGLLKNTTNTVTTIKEPNAKGRNVTLISGTGIGSLNAPLTIDLSNLNALTTEQRAALAAAERGDATVSGSIVTVNQPRPVNVTVGTGALTADAGTGFAYIGSQEDLRIDRVLAAGDIRIKAAESIINAAANPALANVEGQNIILEAANGGIGSIPDPVTGAVSTPLYVKSANTFGITARAAGNIWIEGSQDLSVDTLFSLGNIRLGAVGSVLDFHGGESTITPDNNIRANAVTLTAQTGSIGTPSNPLDVGVNATGAIFATASTVGKGVYLNGPSGENFNIGSVTSGDAVALSSATSMKIDGPVTGPGAISLVAGGLMTLTPNADVHATTLGVFLRAGALTMQDAANGTNAARMRVDVGTIDIQTTGDAIITGIETGNPTASAVRIVSTAGRILDGGDTRLDIIADTPPAAQLTISGALGVGNDPLDVRLLNLQATSAGGVVDIAVENNVNIVAITAGDRVLLTAGGNITGNSVTSTGAGTQNPDKTVNVTSTGGSVNLATVTGQNDVNVSGQSSVTVGTATAGQNVNLSSTNSFIDATNISAPSGSANLVAPGNVTVGTGTAGNTFFVNSTAGNVDVTTLTANAISLNGFGNVTGENLNVGSSLTLAGDNIIANASSFGNSPVGGSITGYSGGVASNINVMLSSPFGYHLSNISTSFGNINVPSGDLFVDNMLVINRLTVSNPQTDLVIDQNNRALQPFDIQLYSGGSPFEFGLTGNRLFTDTFVINRSPMHEVISPTGNNTSVVEQGDKLLSEIRGSRSTDENPDRGGDSGNLVSFTGIPVALEDQKSTDPVQCRDDLNSPDCKDR